MHLPAISSEPVIDVAPCTTQGRAARFCCSKATERAFTVSSRLHAWTDNSEARGNSERYVIDTNNRMTKLPSACTKVHCVFRNSSDSLSCLEQRVTIDVTAPPPHMTAANRKPFARTLLDSSEPALRGPGKSGTSRRQTQGHGTALHAAKAQVPAPVRTAPIHRVFAPDNVASHVV